MGEQDADGPVLVDEEVGALSAGPAVPALLRAFRLHSDAESPAHPVPEAREELSGVLFSAGTWSLVICCRSSAERRASPSTWPPSASRRVKRWKSATVETSSP